MNIPNAPSLLLKSTPDGRHRVGTGRSRSSWLPALTALVLLAGCGSIDPVPQPRAIDDARTVERVQRPAFTQGGRASNTGPQYCRNLYQALERQVVARQVVDAGQQRMAGFPFLRSNRFLASFASDFEQDLKTQRARLGDEAAARKAVLDSAPFAAWVEQLRGLDVKVRHFEIERLPDSALPLYHHEDRASLQADVERCSSVLASRLDAGQLPALLRQADVPDEYQRMLRALGAYPLTGIGVSSSIRNWEAHQRQVFAVQRKSTFSGMAAFQRYQPTHLIEGIDARRQASSIMAKVRRDALGIPLFDEAQTRTLLKAFAPSYEVATVTDSDRIGRLHWIDLRGLIRDPNERFWLDVDTNVPVVYQRMEFTRFGDQVLPQLVYTVWFNERPHESSNDLQAGRLDGLVWRVTLDTDGAPLIYDSIQPSGRYAMFFPTRRLMARARPSNVDELAEWRYSPIDVAIEDWVGQAYPGALSLHVSSRTHQLVGIGATGEEWGSPVFLNPPYALLPEDSLRALPLPGGGHRSIYNQNGIVPDTERRSRLLLWTMGVSKMGSIRQPGRQPTALVGRRHFDDPRLIETRYQRVPVLPKPPAPRAD